ncbi:hypothetical protein JCM8547_002062 [Rhodosporidiobolus lusitaniae]
MAGGSGYHPVKHDPGLESWNYMRENVWQHFRFTKTTARQSIVWGVVLPVLVYGVAQTQDLKWDILGAKKDDPIGRWGDAAKRPSERAAAAQPAADDE